jgi:hypothetical protein
VAERRRFEFGVTSVAGDRVKYRFPHPVEAKWRKSRRFGIQGYGELWKYMPVEPGVGAVDLHTVAVACYFADKHYRRNETADGWSRSFEVSIPVVDPEPWNRGAGALFTKVLEFLTSDRWRLEFRPHARSYVHQSFALAGIGHEPIGAVSLFSGGLDSFCHSAIATAPDSAPRLLVGHAVPTQLVSIQKGLLARLPGSPGVLAQFRVEPHRIRDWSSKKLELSQRTRTLLFLSTALLACDAAEIPVLEIPENGLLALNPPLNVTRLGALSTKSVHSLVLQRLNSVLTELGMGMRIENPVGHMTKGELCAEAAQSLGSDGPSLLADTVSCSSMMPGRWRNTQKAPNCGWCYPCLIRHASLEVAGGDRTRYAVNGSPASASLTEDRARHRRALRRWLSEPFGMPELLAAGAMPLNADPTELVDVVRRSRRELRSVFGQE